MEKKFIRTIDAATAEKLKSLGYKIISHNDKDFVFINAGTNFSSDIDRKKVVFTDLIYV